MSTKNDVLVVGAGLAGLTAVWQLATQQKKVRLVSKGWGVTHWHSGCIDVLGYYPVDDPEPVASPSVTVLNRSRTVCGITITVKTITITPKRMLLPCLCTFE